MGDCAVGRQRSLEHALDRRRYRAVIFGSCACILLVAALPDSTAGFAGRVRCVGGRADRAPAVSDLAAHGDLTRPRGSTS